MRLSCERLFSLLAVRPNGGWPRGGRGAGKVACVENTDCVPPPSGLPRFPGVSGPAPRCPAPYPCHCCHRLCLPGVVSPPACVIRTFEQQSHIRFNQATYQTRKEGLRLALLIPLPRCTSLLRPLFSEFPSHPAPITPIPPCLCAACGALLFPCHLLGVRRRRPVFLLRIPRLLDRVRGRRWGLDCGQCRHTAMCDFLGSPTTPWARPHSWHMTTTSFTKSPPTAPHVPSRPQELHVPPPLTPAYPPHTTTPCSPLVRAMERLRNSATTVQPREWRAATPAEVERAAGQCAICWGEMAGGGRRDVHSRQGNSAATDAVDSGEPAQGSASQPATARRSSPASNQQAAQHEQQREQPALHEAAAPPSLEPGSAATAGAAALPCGHAFHRDCLQQWMQQCYA